MEQQQTSFIPKKPLTASATPQRGEHSGFMLFLGFFVFAMSVASAGSAFIYSAYLAQSIQTKSESIVRAEAAYDAAAIDSIIRLDTRIKNAQELFNKHIGPLPLFAFLEKNTLSNVRFSSFNYSINSNGSVTLSLSGEAMSLQSVALQSDNFSSNRLLHDVIFSGLNTNADGKVAFSVSATMDPEIIVFRNALSVEQVEQ